MSPFPSSVPLALIATVVFCYHPSIHPVMVQAQRSINSVKGTMWSETTDSGGCSLPEADYRVQDAVALGDHPDLGELKIRNALCGHIVRVDCGHLSVDAIVASTCDIGAGTCGVDMIRATWDQATGNKTPGITNCTVSLSSRNAMEGAGRKCFLRPDSGGATQYYVSAGVYNTGKRLVSGATLSGVRGKKNGSSGYFDFNSNGQALFNSDATLVVEYEDGTTESIPYSECENPGGVEIFSG